MTQTPSIVIIDGYNLIKRVPALAARLGGASGLESTRSYLLGRLRAYQATRRRRVVLVLDGPRSGRSDFGPVEVYYAPSADDVICRLAAPGALVVTSDLTVAANARQGGADVLSSEDFWSALTAPPRRGPAASPTPGGRRSGTSDDEDHSGGAPRKGNPRRLSKAERRRQRERDSLMRRV